VRAEGEIAQLYFTVSGDHLHSNVDMKMRYDDFTFQILKDDRINENKLLTAIGNVIFKKSSYTDQDGYRYGLISVDRDPQKAFTNYLWMNVRDGMLNTTTGSGKEKK
jgi:hypothetical protein